MQLNKQRSNDQDILTAGMTLMEVVVALAVFSILLVVAYGSLSSISRSKKTLDDYQDVYLVAQSVLRRMTREFQLITCEKGADLNCIKGKGLIPPEDNGEEKSTALLLAKSGSSSTDTSVTFLAMEAGQYLPEGGTRSGMVQISYRLAKEDPQDSLFTFVRDEIPYLFPASEAYKKLITFPISKNVVSFRLEFYDRDTESWTDSWGVESKSSALLPALIKFALVLRSANGIDIPFETVVPVRTAFQR